MPELVTLTSSASFPIPPQPPTLKEILVSDFAVEAAVEFEPEVLLPPDVPVLPLLELPVLLDELSLHKSPH